MIKGIFFFVVLTLAFALFGAIWSTTTKQERISFTKFILKCMALSALSVSALSLIVVLF